MSDWGLADDLGIGVKQASLFKEKYFDSYPGIQEYFRKTLADANESLQVKTLFNRKRVIEELQNKNFMVRQSGERIALNTPIQGTSADIIKKAMVDIDNAFVHNNVKSKMLLQIHDELVFDIYEDEKQKVLDIVKTIMESVVNWEVPLKVSQDFGTDLYETK